MVDRSYSVLAALQSRNEPFTITDRQAKYTKMAQSAFRFYRGSNHLFWRDFAQDPRRHHFGNEQTTIWVQGDLHTENYGAYTNDAGDLVYDLNDFDEAVVADYQFDLWRMAISIVLMVRQHGIPHQPQGRTTADDDIAPLIDAFVASYLDNLVDHKHQVQNPTAVVAQQSLSAPLEQFLEAMITGNGRQILLEKWTQPVTDGSQADWVLGPKLRHCQFNWSERFDKLAPVDAAVAIAIAHQLPQYGKTLTGKRTYDADHFQIYDIAKRINAGTGSLGVTRYYVLIAGSQPGQERILDIKHQPQPTPYAYLAEGDLATYHQQFGDNHALRHSVAYRALTHHADDYLGWLTLDLPNATSGYFSVRELVPHMKAFDPTTLQKPEDAIAVATTWGQILAAAHASADQHFDPTYVAHAIGQEVSRITAGHHPEFCTLVRAIAFEYADQVYADWQTFLAADLIQTI